MGAGQVLLLRLLNFLYTAFLLYRRSFVKTCLYLGWTIQSLNMTNWSLFPSCCIIYIYFFLIMCFLFVFLFLFSIDNLISFGHLLFLFHFFGFTNFLRHKTSYTQTHLTGKGPSWEGEWTISFSACCTHKCIIQLLNAEEGREEHICMYAFFIWLQELNVYALPCLKDKGCVS